jgi:hypothetical protein
MMDHKRDEDFRKELRKADINRSFKHYRRKLLDSLEEMPKIQIPELSCQYKEKGTRCQGRVTVRFGETMTNQNDIYDEIKSRLNSRNACYHSVKNILSFRLKNTKF